MAELVDLKVTVPGAEELTLHPFWSRGVVGSSFVGSNQTVAVPVPPGALEVSVLVMSVFETVRVSARAIAGMANISANDIKSREILPVNLVRIFDSPLFVVFPADLLFIPSHFSSDAQFLLCN